MAWQAGLRDYEEHLARFDLTRAFCGLRLESGLLIATSKVGHVSRPTLQGTSSQ